MSTGHLSEVNLKSRRDLCVSVREWKTAARMAQFDDGSLELSVPTANQKNAITRCAGDVVVVRGRRRAGSGRRRRSWFLASINRGRAGTDSRACRAPGSLTVGDVSRCPDDVLLGRSRRGA